MLTKKKDFCDLPHLWRKICLCQFLDSSEDWWEWCWWEWVYIKVIQGI